MRWLLSSGRRRLASLILALGVALSGAAVLLSWVPEWILFRQRMLFSILDLDAGAVLLPYDHETHDGLRLRSWYIAPAADMPVIVYFAGRDGDVMRKPAHLFELAGEGYGLLLVGYRGYGGNPGLPREFDMQLDAVALLEHFRRTGVADGGYVLYGYSMGSAIAANAAAQVEARAVVLEAPISSFLEAVRQQARGVPSWLVRTRFDNLARMAEITAPVLLLAGGRDAVTPALFALALADANPAVTRVHVLEDANHFSIIRLGGRQAVREFLAEMEAGALPSSRPDPAIEASASRLPALSRRQSAALASRPGGNIPVVSIITR